MIGRRGGVGSAVGLPVAVAVAVSGSAVGLPVAFAVAVGVAGILGDGMAVADARLLGWLEATSTTKGRTGPLVDEPVGTGWGCGEATATGGGGAGSGRKGDWIVGPPSRVLSRTQT